MAFLLFNRCPLLSKPVTSVLHVCTVTKTVGSCTFRMNGETQVSWLRKATKDRALGSSWFSWSATPISLPMSLPLPSSGLVETSSAGWSQGRTGKKHIWDYRIMRVSAGKGLTDSPHFHLRELRSSSDLTPLHNITYPELKVKWNQLNTLPESSSEMCAAPSGTKHEIRLWEGAWNEGSSRSSFADCFLMPNNKINLGRVIVLL